MSQQGTLDYASLLEDVLARCWPGLRGRVIARRGDCPGPALPRLSERCVLDGVLQAFAAGYPGGDPRATASLFVQWYLATSWPALVTVLLATSRLPAPESTALRLDDHGTPIGLFVEGKGEVRGTQAGLERMVRGHAEALVTGAVAATATSPRVPWSNAINVLGWTLEQLDGIVGTARLADARAFFERKRLADGTTNPLWAREAVQWRRSGRPPRRTCCLRYRLQGLAYCGDCPVPERRRLRDPAITTGAADT